MEQRWKEFEAALRSGDADEVNRVVDEVKEMDVEERVELFRVCRGRLMDLYEAGDGYQRQSVVRVAEHLVPRLEAVSWLTAEEFEEWLGDVEPQRLRTQVDWLREFLLEALEDDDGRVRRSAKRALRDVFRCYDGVDDRAALEELDRSLGAMAEKASGKKQKHIEETREHVQFFFQSPGERILEGLEKMMERSTERTE